MTLLSLSDFEKKHDFSLDLNSVHKVLGNANDVVVYGFKSAHYVTLGDRLKYPDAKLAKVFDYSIGDLEVAGPEEPQERMVYHTEDTEEDRINWAYEAKAGLTNLVLENYKREKEGRALMPLLFCIGSNTAKSLQTITPKSLAEKTWDFVITLKELRRTHKLCKYFEESDDSEMRKLADVAKRTLKLVTVDKTPCGQYTLNLVEPVWNDSSWDAEWTKRMRFHPPGYVKEVLHQKWYKELQERVQHYNSCRADTSCGVAHLGKNF
jgi:hypothetical protein